MMASFIAWYGKKRLRLMQHERDFLEVLRTETDESRLAEAVETIRVAHIRALKEKRQKFAPSERNAVVLDQIGEALRWWTGLSHDEIVPGYRDPKTWRKMSSAVRRAVKQ